MSRRRRIGGVLTLPSIGPFSDLEPTYFLNISDVNLTTVTTLTTTTRTSPLKVNHLTIGSAANYTASTAYCLFIWANVVVVNKAAASAGFIANASVGTIGQIIGSGDPPDQIIGGTGGNGGSGGGGGAANDEFAFGITDGGAGGSGSNGSTGSVVTVNPFIITQAGAGGTGAASTYASGFTYGNGGQGNTASSGVVAGGGAGANGCGGGGGGGSNDSAGTYDAAGAGGGGGGLVCLVCNDLSGTGQFRARGASGTNSGSIDANNGGGGGGGVLWVGARKYSGTLTGDVAAGTGSVPGLAGLSQIFEIKRDGTYVLRTFADVWDNLT
jgi:hypothetical protein